MSDPVANPVAGYVVGFAMEDGSLRLASTAPRIYATADEAMSEARGFARYQPAYVAKLVPTHYVSCPDPEVRPV